MTARTNMNEHSSRSHSVLTVRLQPADGSGPSMLHLVDLAGGTGQQFSGSCKPVHTCHCAAVAHLCWQEFAGACILLVLAAQLCCAASTYTGSERVAKSEAAGQQLREAQHINRSLSALGDVIAALQQGSPHIPYRNSKLTQVLHRARVPGAAQADAGHPDTLELDLGMPAARCCICMAAFTSVYTDVVAACHRRYRMPCAPPPVPRRCWCATWLLRPHPPARRCRASTLRHAQRKWSSDRHAVVTSRPAGQPQSRRHSASSSRLVSGAAITRRLQNSWSCLTLCRHMCRE